MITIHQRYRRTDGQTDRQTTCNHNTALCTKVHRAVKASGIEICANILLYLLYLVYLICVGEVLISHGVLNVQFKLCVSSIRITY